MSVPLLVSLVVILGSVTAAVVHRTRRVRHAVDGGGAGRDSGDDAGVRPGDAGRRAGIRVTARRRLRDDQHRRDVPGLWGLTQLELLDAFPVPSSHAREFVVERIADGVVVTDADGRMSDGYASAAPGSRSSGRGPQRARRSPGRPHRSSGTIPVENDDGAVVTVTVPAVGNRDEETADGRPERSPGESARSRPP
jgi:hypothetical protein